MNLVLMGLPGAGKGRDPARRSRRLVSRHHAAAGHDADLERQRQVHRALGQAQGPFPAVRVPQRHRHN